MRAVHIATAMALFAGAGVPFLAASAAEVVVVQTTPAAPAYCRTVVVDAVAAQDALRIRRCSAYAGAYYYPYSYATGAWYATGTAVVYGTPYYTAATAIWAPSRAIATTGTYTWQSGSVNGISRTTAGYDARTGTAAAGTSRAVHDSATGTWAAGQRVDAANVYNGNYFSGERGAVYNDRTGAAAAGSHGTAGNAQTGRQIEGGRGVVYDPTTGQTSRVGGLRGDNGGIGHVDNTVYVNRNGNVQTKTLQPTQRSRGGGRRRH